MDFVPRRYTLSLLSLSLLHSHNTEAAESRHEMNWTDEEEREKGVDQWRRKEKKTGLEVISSIVPLHSSHAIR